MIVFVSIPGLLALFSLYVDDKIKDGDAVSRWEKIIQDMPDTYFGRYMLTAVNPIFALREMMGDLTGALGDLGLPLDPQNWGLEGMPSVEQGREALRAYFQGLGYDTPTTNAILAQMGI